MTGRGRGRRLRITAAIALSAVVLTVITWCVPWAAPARADTASSAQKVAVFEDATVNAGEVWDNVVVVGGDLLIQGSVKNTVVVVGGDVTVAKGAQVGTQVQAGDTALVVVFGDVSVHEGGSVLGESVDVGFWAAPLTAAAGGSVVRTWQMDSIMSWVWSSIFLAVVAVIATAIAPRQIAAVRDRVRRRFFGSMGWGALMLIIVVPIVTVFMIVTVIGILVAVPWLFIGLPLLSLFGLVAVGAMVGGLLLRSNHSERGPLMLAAAVGVIVINLARWIPVAGVIILVLLWFVGVGATVLALWTWLREGRRRRREQQRMQRGAGAGYGSWPPAPPAVPPYQR